MNSKKLKWAMWMLLAMAPATAVAQQAQVCGSAARLTSLLAVAEASGAQSDRDALVRELWPVSKCLAEKGLLKPGASGLKGVFAPVLEIVAVLEGRVIEASAQGRISAAVRKLPKPKKQKKNCPNTCAS